MMNREIYTGNLMYKDILFVIDCSQITIENLAGELEKYRSRFSEAVKEFQAVIG